MTMKQSPYSNISELAFPKIPNHLITNRPKVGSLFSGCGGLDLAFKNAGCEISWANDIDPLACQTYSHYLGDHIINSPVEKIEFEKLKKVDIILGGFPCQDFSVIWKRPGLKGSRGSLYSYLVKAVKINRPKIFIGENVKGLLSIAGGAAIKKIINDFHQLGYEISHDLYNFADYGAAQLRERVLFIGVRNDLGFKFKQIPKTHNVHVTAKEALKGVAKVPYNNEHQKIAEKTKSLLSMIPPGKNFSAIPPDSPLYVKGMISHVYRRLHPDKPSTTIIAAGGGGTWGYHWGEPRPLTNRERARLFGFPDDMIFFGSISDVRRQIGNAVPPVGAFPVAKEIVAILRGDPQYKHASISSFAAQQKGREVGEA
jgi:DNA (cytosine-5)-methyltransferase 1